MVRAADQRDRLRGLGSDQARGCQLGKFGVAGCGDRIGGLAQIDARRTGRVALDPDLVRHCGRSEEHTSALQSLMRISYAVFCLQQKTQQQSYYNEVKCEI